MKFWLYGSLGFVVCGALMALKRAICTHLPVLKSGGGKVETRCDLCGKTFGQGWDFRDLKPPIPCLTEEERRRACLALVEGVS